MHWKHKLVIIVRIGLRLILLLRMPAKVCMHACLMHTVQPVQIKKKHLFYKKKRAVHALEKKNSTYLLVLLFEVSVWQQIPSQFPPVSFIWSNS